FSRDLVRFGETRLLARIGVILTLGFFAVTDRYQGVPNAHRDLPDDGLLALVDLVPAVRLVARPLLPGEGHRPFGGGLARLLEARGEVAPGVVQGLADARRVEVGLDPQPPEAAAPRGVGAR